MSEFVQIGDNTDILFPAQRRKSHSELSAGSEQKAKATPRRDPFDVGATKFFRGTWNLFKQLSLTHEPC
jgi:hypothetical protein